MTRNEGYQEHKSVVDHPHLRTAARSGRADLPHRGSRRRAAAYGADDGDVSADMLQEAGEHRIHCRSHHSRKHHRIPHGYARSEHFRTHIPVSICCTRALDGCHHRGSRMEHSGHHQDIKTEQLGGSHPVDFIHPMDSPRCRRHLRDPNPHSALLLAGGIRDRLYSRHDRKGPFKHRRTHNPRLPQHPVCQVCRADPRAYAHLGQHADIHRLHGDCLPHRSAHCRPGHTVQHKAGRQRRPRHSADHLDPGSDNRILHCIYNKLRPHLT